MEVKQPKNETKNSLYEVGFLVVSSIPEEQVAGEVSKLKAIIEENGGEIKADEYPKLRTLSYEMKKAVGGHNYKRYNTAYFGWVRFEMSPESILKTEESIAKEDNILRFILIKVSKDEGVIMEKVSKKEVSSEKVVGVKKEEKSDKPINEEDLDKTIQDLVIE